jgi:hypothetical protein
MRPSKFVFGLLGSDGISQALAQPDVQFLDAEHGVMLCSAEF